MRAIPSRKGRMLGAAILVIGIVCVFAVKRNKVVPEADQPIRPIKTMIVGEARSKPGGHYFGKVRPAQQALMSFAVSGALKTLPIKEGQQVKSGDVLGTLDDRDYRNALAVSEADLKKFEAQLGRLQRAFKSKAVSEQDVSNAEAAVDAASAQVKIRAKALEDATLVATFDGFIAKVFVDNHENIMAKQKILSLQDLSGIEIVIDVPESRVASVDPRRRGVAGGDITFTAGLDYWKERSFDVVLKEFSTEADPVTQTFTATFAMEVPEDVTVLPGMTVVVTEHIEVISGDNLGGFSVPLDAVPVDGLGQYFVWVLVSEGDGIYHAARSNVEVGVLTGSDILVTSGIKQGDIVALAGVSILREDQKVRLQAGQ
jgi:multidrug efflux system membrane fusion protein